MDSAYLLEILTCKGDFLIDINAKINEIVQQTNSLKNDVKLIIDEGSINFNPLIEENLKLKTQAKALIQDMMLLQENINFDIEKELSSCTSELKTLSKELQEVNISLYFLNQLIEIYTSIKNANIKIENKEFHECAQLIMKVQELIENSANELKFLEIYKTLSNEAVITYEHLIHHMNELWSTYVGFDVKEKCEVKVISFYVSINFATELSEILSTLNCLKFDLTEKKFINDFQDKIVNVIIMQKVIICEKIGERAVLILEVINNENKPNYFEVFLNLTKAIEFLKTHLNIKSGSNFLNKVGNNISNELAEKLIKNCLSGTVPCNSEDLEQYNDIVKNTEEFEVKLKGLGFLPKNSTSLTDYAKNINVLFANKFCQTYLEKARIIMKKDLYNTISAEELVINKIIVLPVSHRRYLKHKLFMQENEFIFPKCQISKSAEELLDLVMSIINEILRSQDLCAIRLFYTIRNIFEMYSAIVPLHHKKFLDTLPQQVAIFHNNCIYFTHILVNLTCEYYGKIPSIAINHFDKFLEEAILLRELAAETLEQHVTNQKKQLIHILRNSGIAFLKADPKLDLSSEKCIRQCIRQLQILHSVWKDVLPLKVYNRAIGFLFDSIIEELILLIIAVEDISSQTASHLASLFKIIIERAPSLFPEPLHILKYIKKWQKFKELIAVLEGSLRDVDDRWANGVGPLANQFTAYEVRRMIRALFQNSERRSLLLNKIK